MKRILITGGNGFIARNLENQLQDEYDTISCSRNQLNILDQIEVSSFIRDHDIDIIIHTATYDAAPIHSTKNPHKVLENNLKMFFNIVSCSNYVEKIIYYGSGAEFDKDYYIPRMKESYIGTHIPTDQYGFSKYIMNKHAEQSSNIYNLRLFGVFGPHDDWRTRFIPNTCYQIFTDHPIVIHQNNRLNFVYIDDLVKITKYFIDNHVRYNTYNVCSAITRTYDEIAEQIIEISNKTITIEVENKGIEYSGNNTRLRNEITGLAFAPFLDSLTNLYEFYKTNGMC
ncbi:MAG: NAD(P)-dependent oxidoreductase [Candidatus Peribacteraceae bacterium]|nr:NAD(P)-dependent oxidoreductase [Candidatus Peribacteraceae bacterium]